MGLANWLAARPFEGSSVRQSTASTGLRHQYRYEASTNLNALAPLKVMPWEIFHHCSPLDIRSNATLILFIAKYKQQPA